VENDGCTEKDVPRGVREMMGERTLNAGLRLFWLTSPVSQFSRSREPSIKGFSLCRTPNDMKCCPAAWDKRVGRPQGQKGDEHASG
jgi:hypothetical protein